MIGTFGTSIIFEVSEDHVLAFKKLTQNVKGRWASHETLGAKPKKEFLGADAREGALEIYLCRPWGSPAYNIAGPGKDGGERRH